MTTAKRILSLIIASWSLTIAAGIPFTPQSGDALRTSVGSCAAGKPDIPELDIYIQYCGGWGYGKQSSQLKKQLDDAFQSWKRTWSVREVKDPGVTGNFEVVVNGEKVWSKTDGQGFPDTQDKVETIIAAIKAKETASLIARNQIKTSIAGPDIHIQYCGGWGYGPKSKQLKKQLEEAFDGQISVRETKDPGVTGNFEVFVNGDLIWSKRTRGQDFPTSKAEIDTICDEIRDRQN